MSHQLLLLEATDTTKPYLQACIPIIAIFFVVGIPGKEKRPAVRTERRSLSVEQPCESTCNALDTLISGANEVGNCLRDTLCTEINCESLDMTVNLTFFPCNGTVSIHYLVILRGSGDIAANVTTSEDYSGRLNGVPGTLHLFLTQLDSGIAFGVSWMEVLHSIALCLL